MGSEKCIKNNGKYVKMREREGEKQKNYCNLFMTAKAAIIPISIERTGNWLKFTSQYNLISFCLVIAENLYLLWLV